MCTFVRTYSLVMNNAAKTEATETDPRIERACRELDIEQLPSGDWAYYDDGMGRWYVVTSEDLVVYADYLDSDDEDIRRDAYSHWCSATQGEEMPKSWEPGMNVYVYTIYDADPDATSGGEWPSHVDVELAAGSDDAAISDVRDALEVEAAGLSTTDGYEVEQRIYALVSMPDGTTSKVAYTLTAEDLA